jgi:hypothetical protein
MASWIADCLILTVGFCNIYLIFLHTKIWKAGIDEIFSFQFISLEACFSAFQKSVEKFAVCFCFWLLSFSAGKASWEAEMTLFICASAFKFLKKLADG